MSFAAGWREGRRYLDDHRHELALWAAETLYPDHPRAAGTGLLTRPDWVRTTPVPLADVRLAWREPAADPPVNGTEPDCGPYATYAEAVADLAPPRVFEDRPCYRLLDVSAGPGRVDLGFGLGRYFDVINTCEAAAHELADARRLAPAAVPPDLPLRSMIGDPCDVARRPVMVAISALTLRRSPAGATFVLHRRDAAKVAHAGGMTQVMPVGVFQPSGPGPEHQHDDFDLWRSLSREYHEEFLGAPEQPGADGPFFRALDEARRDGCITAHFLGLGVDPLSLVTDILVAVVFDAGVYDALFAGAVAVNAEGHVTGHHPFDEATVGSIVTTSPMQAAGAAALALAWQHRATLLPGSD
ncbi:MAG TPA: hypothetical protein VH479_03690 [Acidimicrobiales bacterium]